VDVSILPLLRDRVQKAVLVFRHIFSAAPAIPGSAASEMFQNNGRGDCCDCLYAAGCKYPYSLF
ncbi:MAG: hypothetical protein QMC67_03070, partial [Candidatus Wallbacteria bacterium]